MEIKRLKAEIVVLEDKVKDHHGHNEKDKEGKPFFYFLRLRRTYQETQKANATSQRLIKGQGRSMRRIRTYHRRPQQIDLGTHVLVKNKRRQNQIVKRKHPRP